MTTIRSQPCTACPYRLDCPSGIWHPDEYAKLRDYDRPTGEQPVAAFACHATPDHLCHGWAVVGSNRGPGYDLLALRFAELVAGAPIEIPDPAVPMFATGTDAADWGEADVDQPGPDAATTITRLVRKYPRLRTTPE
jgi:hypothetical protein